MDALPFISGIIDAGLSPAENCSIDGLSERERWRYEFAGRAMASIMTIDPDKVEKPFVQAITLSAVIFADALLAELEKKQ